MVFASIKEVTLQKISQANDLTMGKICQKALALLAQREYFCYSLQSKLLQKGFTLTNIQPVLQELIYQDLLSDQRFCEMRIYAGLNKGHGPYKIAAGLLQHGIDEALINQHLDLENETWLSILKKVHHKKFGLLSPAEPREQMKQIRYLQHRGFRLSQINQLLKQLPD